MTTTRSTNILATRACPLLLLMWAAVGCGVETSVNGGSGGTGVAPGTGGSLAGTGGVAPNTTGGAPGSGGASVATGGAPAEDGGTDIGIDSGSGGQPGSGGQMGTGGSGGDATGGGAGRASTGGSGAGTGGVGGRGGGAATGGRGGAGGSAGGSGPPAFDRTAVMSIMRRVADYEIGRFGTTTSNGWVRATFHTGMLAAYRALGDVKYRDYTRRWGQANSWLVSRDSSAGPRFADNQTCFQSYAELYLDDPVPANNVLLTSAQTVFDSMVSMPRAGRDEWWWCDALFMAPPAMVRMSQAVNKPQYLTLMHTMFFDTRDFLFDPAQNLFWRDGTFRNTSTYWSRGNGWVVGGLARVLEYLPATDARRADYENLLRLMTTKLRSIQGADGFWRSSLTNAAAFPTPESSGTAFFCFGMAWGINHGVLDRATFLPTVTRAWNALVTAVNAQGRLGWVQAVGSRPGPSTADNTNDYATGAFLLAGEQILKL